MGELIQTVPVRSAILSVRVHSSSVFEPGESRGPVLVKTRTGREHTSSALFFRGEWKSQSWELNSPRGPLSGCCGKCKRKRAGKARFLTIGGQGLAQATDLRIERDALTFEIRIWINSVRFQTR